MNGLWEESCGKSGEERKGEDFPLSMLPLISLV